MTDKYTNRILICIYTTFLVAVIWRIGVSTGNPILFGMLAFVLSIVVISVGMISFQIYKIISNYRFHRRLGIVNEVNKALQDKYKIHIQTNVQDIKRAGDINVQCRLTLCQKDKFNPFSYLNIIFYRDTQEIEVVEGQKYTSIEDWLAQEVKV